MNRTEADDIILQLRLLAHPFTGLEMSESDRQALIRAAEMIESLSVHP